MTKRVKIELQKLEESYKGYSYPLSTWEHLVSTFSNISFTTFCKYVKLEKVEHKEERTLEEIVGLLNSCAGDDCYCADWQFEVIDGKPYEVWYEFKWN
jgi:hypothetical protein